MRGRVLGIPNAGAPGSNIGEHAHSRQPIMREPLPFRTKVPGETSRPGTGAVLVRPPEEGDGGAGDTYLSQVDGLARPAAWAGQEPAAARHGPGRGVDQDRARAGVPDRRPAGR